MSNNTIKGVKVNLGDKTIAGDTYEAACNESNFFDCITDVISKLKTKEIDLLLDDQLCYVLNFSLDKNINKHYERAEVFKHVQKNIPEVLNDSDWDYKEGGENDNKVEFLIFAPVKSKFQFIAKAILNSKCKVRVVESVSLAKFRNTDPFIGIALKKDIKGVDSQVLNISLEQFTSQEQKNRKIEMHKISVVLTAALIGGIVLSLIYFISKTFPGNQNLETSKNDMQYENEDSSAVSLENLNTEETSETTESQENIDKLELSVYSIQILNGTGKAGLAAKVSELLKTKGFADFEIGNADKNNYEKTTIFIQTIENPEKLKGIFTEALGEYEYTIKEPLNSKIKYDVIITLGNDLIIGE
ncbi:hypothetical protein A3A69_02300 [candidate division WWE3 bacterium RIFCSPLOWO2_01_FULL_37_15]|uniref:LytR/CpsA/Psr regulator C-terminal domain-containing protein n=1 Tax=candidate division WWE3 bacterium RIFCSPLOWO2_01_FULL_37_15 TaxID=1802622 RepID=A0A1F4UXX4_UNCKA|nr:MAG: hypothetical protein A3A69_02300 [candidate division WWE3 bacterium RIFCSPLOWO2_01_FULL_37_15]